MNITQAETQRVLRHPNKGGGSEGFEPAFRRYVTKNQGERFAESRGGVDFQSQAPSPHALRAKNVGQAQRGVVSAGRGVDCVQTWC